MPTLLKNKGIDPEELLKREPRPQPAPESNRGEAPDVGDLSRKDGPRRPGRWTVAALIFATALLVVLFVANSIRVNELLVEIDSVEQERDAVRETNHRMRSTLLQLTSVDRITKIASQQGLRLPETPPEPLLIRKFEEDVE